jgi:RND superfamily putative drug exporter
MLERLGHFLVRRRRWVLIGTLVTIVLAGVFGGNVTEHLKAGGFDSTDVESQRASDLLGKTFKQAPPNFLLLVTAKQGSVNDPAVRQLGVRLTNELITAKGVGQVLSHWSLGPTSPLQSTDKTKAIIVAEIVGDDEARGDIVEVLQPEFTFDTADASVRVGGFEAIFKEVSEQIESDLAKAESIAIPITLILLIVVFGSLVAASLPIGIGVLAVLGTFLVLRLIALATDVSVFALSMVTAMGLGLAIDYSLFIVSRFREELRKGADTETAIVTTVKTAGRTVIFSGSTVAVSLAALLVFPLYFFKSFGYAGIGVVITAVAGAVIALPALLAVLGPRVDWAPSMQRKGARRTTALRTIWGYIAVPLWYLTWPIQWLLRRMSDWQRTHHKEVGEGFWHRLAVVVMRRPWRFAIGVTLVLLALGIPFLHVNPGLPDERVLPPSAETRKVHDALRKDFSTEEVNSIRVVARNVQNPVVEREKIAVFAASLSKLDGVAVVDSFAGEYKGGVRVRAPGPLEARFASADATWFQVIPSVDPFSEDAEALVHRIRGSNTSLDILVGGSSAQLVDAKATLFGRLPIAIALIALSTFVMLFLMFGSLLVPLKALVLNFLSLTATFGAMVWIFQDGHLSGFLNFTPTGSLDISSPILMFCIAFGLSMDFEVFLLSRIKEEYDRTGQNEHSVAVGLELTGRIVTAAAVLISVTFIAFGTSSVRFIKLFGIGMALAVLMDAFVIRGTLVPAFMRLAGNANWWLPKFLRPLYARFRISESGEHAAEAVVVDRAGPTHPPTAPRRPKAKPKPVSSRHGGAERSRKKGGAKPTTARKNGRSPSAAKRNPAAKATTKTSPSRKATR